MNNVRDFGAVGDGVANDTRAIQAAIDAGGTVYFPSGAYRTGTLYLRSDGGLLLDDTATLIASTDPDDFSKRDFCEQEKGSNVGSGSHAHLIVALEVRNVFIRGGRFDGNARSGYPPDVKPDYTLPCGPCYPKPAWRLQQLLFICECENVRLSDFTIVDAPCWGCFLYGCENVQVSGLNIRNDPFVNQDDGIDIDCCRHVTVSDCIIDVGDDALTLRGGVSRLKKPRACEYVTVSNCILRSAYAHAIRIGVGGGTIRHSIFNGIVCHGSRTAIHINSKYSDFGTGVDIHDLAFRNFQVDVLQLAFITLDYKFVRETKSSKTIRDIVFSNVAGSVALPSQLRGNASGTVERIAFENVKLNVVGKYEIPDTTRKFLMVKTTDGAFELEHVKSCEFLDVRLAYDHPEIRKCDVAALDCGEITVSGGNLMPVMRR